MSTLSTSGRIFSTIIRVPSVNVIVRPKFCKFSTSTTLCQLDIPTPPEELKPSIERTGGKEWSRARMRAWEINSFGGLEELRLNDRVRIPIIMSPYDLLIQVKAASVNPLDVQMCKGYGSDAMNAVRQLQKQKIPLPWKNTTVDFPLTFGRDFAGVVTEIGSGVNTFKVGDEVYGVLNFTERGSHADYVVASKNLIQRKPSFLSFAEAASFPYVGLTCWSAVTVTGNFCDLTNKRFLILGGSGGVGTFAIQYLKAHGAYVIATGSSDSQPLLEELGSNGFADYTAPDYETLLKAHAPYDCILNLSGPRNDLEKHYSSLLKPLVGQYITLSPPALSNFDRHGFLGGMLKNGADLLRMNLNSLVRDRVITKWGFFVPSGRGFRAIADLVANGRIKPVVQETFDFNNLPAAYAKVDSGHLRGKIVVEM